MYYLILGASGFIGRNLVHSLASDKRNSVVAFSRKGLDCFGFLDNVSVVEGDFLRLNDFDSLLEGIDIVYYLIATSKPSNTNCNIAAEMTDLIDPTDRLLKACIRQSVTKVLFVSSGGTVYGKDQIPPFNESMREQPINAYGIQKVQIEKMLYLYNYLYGLDYSIVRLANPTALVKIPQGILELLLHLFIRQLMGRLPQYTGTAALSEIISISMT